MKWIFIHNLLRYNCKNNLNNPLNNFSSLLEEERWNHAARELKTMDFSDWVNVKLERKTCQSHEKDEFTRKNGIYFTSFELKKFLWLPNCIRPTASSNFLGSPRNFSRPIISKLDFISCSPVWDTCGKGLRERVQKIQNRAARIITRSDYAIRSDDILRSLVWNNLETRRLK